MEVPESHRLNGRNEDRVTQMEEFQKKFHSFIFKLIKQTAFILNVNAFNLLKYFYLIIMQISNAFKINAFMKSNSKIDHGVT